jgi:beta-glucosidase
MTKSAKALPYRNPSLTISQRVEDLLSRMTLEEKVSQLQSNSPAIKRLGIDAYPWFGECLHGLVHTGRATVFPAALALAATFDADLIRQVGDAIASEARAKHHDKAWYKASGPRVGLNFWTPVVNLLRDGRWGRAQETYGEDPYLSGAIGGALVRGLQGSHPRYMKVAACAKHFAVHSGPERIRGDFNAVIPPKDLRETYLPAFKMLVDAGVETVMGAYNRLNGEACCGSKTLLTDILRRQWGFDGHVVSDGGALHGLHGNHKVTADEMGSAVMGVKAGCDMDNSAPPLYRHLPEALEKGLVSAADIDACVRRVLATRFKLGMFDDPARVPYTKIKPSVIGSPKHIRLARQSALESIVMLKNNGALPLKPSAKTVFVTGPNAADVQVLLGNFYRGVTPNAVTVLEGVVAQAPEGVAVTHMQGCYTERPNVFPSNWAFGLAEWADALVAVVGISPLMEGESGECIGAKDGGDRDEHDLGLPPHQIEFVRRLAGMKKPLIVVVTGGSPISMPEIHELADAVLFAWYPGEQGGTAVGDIIFGHESPSGRLPVTFPKSVEQLPPFADYSMRGRTYRYMTEEPLYPFGFGLSFARFKYGKMQLTPRRVRAGESAWAEVVVTNAGPCVADEVVQLYITDDVASTTTPLSALKGIQRIRLAPKKSARVRFEITPEMMMLVNDTGESVLEPGAFTVTIGGSSPGQRSHELGAPKPAVGKFNLI